MQLDMAREEHSVNCRIGSLENHLPFGGRAVDVNCRIGSLEMLSTESKMSLLVNCRIGSLENGYLLPCLNQYG